MRITSATRLLVCGLLLCGGAVSRVRADDAPFVAPASLARNALWLSASGTLACASLGGYYALQVENTYDRSRRLPSVSPEQRALHDEARDTAFVADGFFIGAVVLGVTSVVLWLVLPAEQTAPAPMAVNDGRLLLRGTFL